MTELVFVTSPVAGHLGPTVELANLLTRRHPQISVTIFILHFPFELLRKFTGNDCFSGSVRLVPLPPVEVTSSGRGDSMTPLVKANIPLVRAAVRDLLTRYDGSVRLAGFVLDMGFTAMMDLADEFRVPSYLFFTPSAAFLRFVLHFQLLHDHQGLSFDEFEDPNAELEVPSYVNAVPAKVFPSFLLDEKEADWILPNFRRYRQVKGFLVNTFVELESQAIQSFAGCTPPLPPLYAVGPIVNGEAGFREGDEGIARWLDDQPPSSVVFLCFGSMGGGLVEDQIKEIARALEQTGFRFLWSIGRKPQKGKTEIPREYTDDEIEQVLPEGFLQRTAVTGKVIGWAPQVAVLSHPAVGGFVSHCGWNSIIESVRAGVPIATWPMHAEQKVNAFQMVRDLGLAEEIKIDHDRDSDNIVSSHEIEIGLRKVMSMNSQVRKKSTEMQEMSRKAVADGGSSHVAVTRFIEDLMTNMQASNG